ncbi:MAG: CAP domain-containing protein [Bacteroidales bacterium]|nr:CAP domain-containing protein [Bacteroidales bacterium]MDY0286482.1 CAP domain-containing protein [Bacteroidales bacterium]
MKKRIIQCKSIVFLSILLSSCGPEGSDPAKHEITGHPIFTRTEVVAAYNNIYLATAVENPQWDGNLAACLPGSIPTTIHDKVLARINYFRKMCGLPGDVVFNTEYNEKCQAAALMFLANSGLSHDPPTTWSCWSSDGYEAAQCSNIGLGSANTPVHTTRAIDCYMDDSQNSNFTLGHRRWLLYSKAKTMGHGSTDRSNAIWVAGNTGNPLPDNLPDFIAYPSPGCFPCPLCFPIWSFSVPEANFANTNVVMSDENGNKIDLTVNYKSKPGDPLIGDNSIIWQPAIINDCNKETTYKITLTNVALNNEIYSYSYQVTLIPVEE